MQFLNVRNLGKRTLASLLVMTLACALVFSQQQSGEYTFRAKTELVLVNVTVRDKNGNPVKDLKPEDFTVFEDNKPQHIVSFDLENTDAVVSSSAAEAPLLAQPPSRTVSPGSSARSAAGSPRPPRVPAYPHCGWVRAAVPRSCAGRS